MISDINMEKDLIERCREINSNLRIINRIERLTKAPLTQSELEFLLLYIEMYRNLSSHFADDEMMRQWLFTYNSTLDGYPNNLIISKQSLLRVNEYIKSLLHF